MTKKDYKIIAGAIKEIIQAKAKGKRIAEIIGGVLQSDNHRFDWNKFYEACGVSEKE